MPRPKKKTKRASGGIAFEKSRKKYKVTYKGEYVGRYNTKAEAEEALYNYIHRPEIEPSSATFKDVYEEWYKEHLEEVAVDQKKDPFDVERSSSFHGHRAAFSAFSSVHNTKFTEIKNKDLMAAVKSKNQPMQRKMKILINYLRDYALINEIINNEKKEVFKIKTAAQSKSEKHYPFTQTEIDKLWDSSETDMFIQLVLMGIYSGCRFGEIVKLKKVDVCLEKNYFEIKQGKNKNAKRFVPIHNKTKKFWENWMEYSASEYLVVRKNGTPFNFSTQYSSFMKGYWCPKLDALGVLNYERYDGEIAMHLPHDMRSTFTTRWTEQELNEIKRCKIQGHAFGNIGIDVYAKLTVEDLTKELNKLK